MPFRYNGCSDFSILLFLDILIPLNGQTMESYRSKESEKCSQWNAASCNINQVKTEVIYLGRQRLTRIYAKAEK